jgi:murein L,D-transpeptidase YafK
LAFAAFASAATSPAIDLVKVDKSDRALSLMSQGKVVARFPIVLGGNPAGHKQQEGDQRTPEGRYILDFKKQDSAFFRAIHISYPNQADIRRAQKAGVSPGGAIMIHGQKNGLGWLSALSQRYDWTDGCIALSNEHMQRVWSFVQVPTAIEIAP